MLKYLSIFTLQVDGERGVDSIFGEVSQAITDAVAKRA